MYNNCDELTNSKYRDPKQVRLVAFCMSFHHFSQAASVKINNLLTCFCRFDLSYPILEKENFIEIVLLLLLETY